MCCSWGGELFYTEFFSGCVYLYSCRFFYGAEKQIWCITAAVFYAVGAVPQGLLADCPHDDRRMACMVQKTHEIAGHDADGGGVYQWVKSERAFRKP